MLKITTLPLFPKMQYAVHPGEFNRIFIYAKYSNALSQQTLNSVDLHQTASRKPSDQGLHCLP